MLKRVFYFLFILSLMFSCKVINVKDKDTTARVIFKNLMRKSEKLNKASFSGLMRVEGVKDIPAAYLKFESTCDFKSKKVNFKMIAIRTPIFDISFNDNDVIIISHTTKEYIKLKIDKLDFSKLIGVNFNPLDIGYFFLGKVPYSESMELVDFKWSKKEYQITMSDNQSKYTIYLTNNEEITFIEMSNQYLGNLAIGPIVYKNDKKLSKIPSILIITNDDAEVKITFRINKSILDFSNKDLIDYDKIMKNYTEVTDINKIKVDKKKIFSGKEE